VDTPVVTVLGGTGFLGESIVRHLLERGFAVRVGSRHPRRVSSRADDLRVRSVGVDIHDEASLAGALSGAHAAVNAVSLYVEHGSETFRTVHVDCAQRIATVARRVGLETLVHISGIGADAGSRLERPTSDRILIATNYAIGSSTRVVEPGRSGRRISWTGCEPPLRVVRHECDRAFRGVP
jgi:uncharacterized protein YbjT (DUF2867 family)